MKVDEEVFHKDFVIDDRGREPVNNEW